MIKYMFVLVLLRYTVTTNNTHTYVLSQSFNNWSPKPKVLDMSAFNKNVVRNATAGNFI